MSLEQDKIFEKILSDNLNRTIGWVIYAEAKHVALLTFCLGAIAATVAKVTEPETTWLIELGGLASAPFFVFGACIALASFLPRTGLTRLYKPKDRKAAAGKNLLFYGDVSRLTPTEAGQKFKERYVAPDGEILSANFVDDISAQILANSIVAVQKFEMFETGVAWVVGGIAVIFIFAGAVILHQL